MTEQFVNYFQKFYKFSLNKNTKQYGVLNMRTNRYVDNSTLFSAYSEAQDAAGVSDTGITLADVNKYVSENIPHAEEEEALPPSEFVKRWLKANEKYWSISPAWKEISYIRGGASTPKDLEELRNSIMAYIYDNKLGYKVEEIKSVLGKMAMDGMQDAVIDIMSKIAYDPSCLGHGEDFLHAIHEHLMIEEDYDTFATIMRHWAWTVKRKLANKEVTDHIWPNYYGGTGLGKTTLIKKMCSPMSDFVSVTNIAKLFDDTKEIKRLTENYVMVFDELAVDGMEVDAQLSKDRLSLLKSIITGEKLDARIYSTQNQAKRRLTFSCISSANYHLYDIIFDPTSMRRFFEFHCKAKRPDSFDEINKFLDNPEPFWKSIDENRDGGYWNPKDGGIGSAISKIQEAYYPTKTTTAMWIKAKAVRAGNKSLDDAYESYKWYCKRSGNTAKARQNFAKDVRHMVPDSVGECDAITLDWDENFTPAVQRAKGDDVPDSGEHPESIDW